MEHYEVVIVGGGLAGLTAALDLRGKGHAVLVCEKTRYPHHKVCGEYISREVLPYLDRLGVPLEASGTVSIDTLEMSTVQGRSLTVGLPLGGIGASRYFVDNLLYRKALGKGVEFVFGNVSQITYGQEQFSITLASGRQYAAKVAIGAFGKRSNLDKQLQRPFFYKKSPWLGIKAHYDHSGFPEHLVALHNFEGGYAGLSKTETGAVNFCYLASYDSFKKETGIQGFQENVVAKNPFLASFLGKARPLFAEPMAIAQISFHEKNAVEDHILMCGDSAGLIHPLCGNGMAMAIHSAKLVSEAIHPFLNQKRSNRQDMERSYARAWNRTFHYRLRMGRWLQAALLNPQVCQKSMGFLARSPWLLRTLIKQTHGSPIV